MINGNGSALGMVTSMLRSKCYEPGNTFNAISIVPIAIEKSFLEGRGLTKGDPAEFEEEGISRENDAQASFGTHNFHTGKIMVSVYESEAAKVRIDGSLYDEHIHVLEGLLILTPDGGGEYEFKQGDSLVVPEGFTGYWHMPENYRELIVVDTGFMEEGAKDS
jgi:uncharacterized cupin superfamily protein